MRKIALPPVSSLGGAILRTLRNFGLPQNPALDQIEEEAYAYCISLRVGRSGRRLGRQSKEACEAP